jgi:hypothetical protein
MIMGDRFRVYEYRLTRDYDWSSRKAIWVPEKDDYDCEEESADFPTAEEALEFFHELRSSMRFALLEYAFDKRGRFHPGDIADLGLRIETCEMDGEDEGRHLATATFTFEDLFKLTGAVTSECDFAFICEDPAGERFMCCEDARPSERYGADPREFEAIGLNREGCAVTILWQEPLLSSVEWLDACAEENFEHAYDWLHPDEVLSSPNFDIRHL